MRASVRSFSGAAVRGRTCFRPLPHSASRLTARAFSAQSERSTWRISHRTTAWQILDHWTRQAGFFRCRFSVPKIKPRLRQNSLRRMPLLDELCHQLLNFRSEYGARAPPTSFLQSSSYFNSLLSPKKRRDRLKSAAPTTSVRQQCAAQLPEPLPTVPAGVALTFPHTSLSIQVLMRLERKIVERLRSSTSRIAEG